MSDRPVVHGLVIGAMKSGTTTLYHDLRRIPGLSLPAKELDFFQRPAELVTPAAYRELFTARERTMAEPVVCRVDISTTYTMWPEVPDVPERAAELLADRPVRLVYLVRNPIERAISHHHHMVARGATSADFASSVEADPGVVGFGRYDLQARRWTTLFGEDALLVVRLDDYSSDWAPVVTKILAHLGVHHDIEGMEPPTPENVTAEARVFTGRSRRVAESALFGSLYRNGLRRVVPESLRRSLRSALLPAPPMRPTGPGPGPELLQRLVEQLQPAAAYVAEATDTEPWDLAATADELLVDHGR